MRIKVLKQGGYASGGIVPAGGNMSGPLILANNPVENLEASTKQYLDTALNNLNVTNLTSGTIPIERFPGMTGDISNNPGSNIFTLSSTGISPGNYPKVTVNNKGRITNGYILSESDLPDLSWSKVSAGKPTTLAGYEITDGIQTSGGTLTGDLFVNVPPTDPLHIVNKSYIDDLVADNLPNSYKTGDIVKKLSTTTPIGFLRCNGGQVAKTTYPALYSILSELSTMNVDYTAYNSIGNGQPWRQQYNFKTSTKTDITGWRSEGNLPYSLGFAQAIVTKNRVYLLGGYNGFTASYSSVSYTAPINSDGSLGAWTTGTSLPGALGQSQAIVTKNRVYLLGGYVGTNTVSVVYTAPINEDGTLGAWTTGTSLPGPLSHSQAVVTKNRIYLLGGIITSPGNTNIVYTAPINADGTLGAWTTGTSLPAALSHSQAVVTKNRVYLLGGREAGYGNTNKVYTAPINSDGTLGAWTAGSPLLTALGESQAIVSNNRVYLLAGYNDIDGGGYINTIYTAPINTDGTLGTWTTGGNLILNLDWTQAIVVKNKIYTLGGNSTGGYYSNIYSAIFSDLESVNDYSKFYDGSINKFDGSNVTGQYTIYRNTDNYTHQGSGQPWRQQYQFNTQQSADITGWTLEANSLPGNLYDSQVIVTKNRVYLLGGYNGTAYTSVVYTAPINEDGTLGVWTTDTSLPSALGFTVATLVKNRIYLFAGNNGLGAINTVYTTTINSDGTLGAWTTAASLPMVTSALDSIITKNRVYVFGNYTGNAENDKITYYANINTDGTLGPWTQGTLLPGGLSVSQAVVTKNRVYLLGGVATGNNHVSTVYTAPISDEGVVGTWTTATSLPNILSYSESVVTRNRVYLFGGHNGSSAITTVYTAPINSDGTLGAWTTGTALPAQCQATQAIVTKNRIYLAGGFPSAPGKVYSASFAGGLNDYTSYYDGSMIPTDSNNFRLPDYSNKELYGSYTFIKY